MIIVRLILQTVILAFGQLRANKTRSFLTALGIVVGVASVAFVISALRGMQGFVLDQFESVGTRYVYIDGVVPPSLEDRFDHRQVQLSLEEVEAIDGQAETIEKITPIWSESFEVASGDITLEGVRISGAWPEWVEIENRPVILGRPFSRIDNENRRYVCLINDRGIEELNLDRDPTGDHIFVGGRRFLIVGVVETKELGMMFGGGEPQTEIIIPFETCRKIAPHRYISDARALLTSEDVAEEAQAEVGFILRTMRDLDPEDEDTFVIQVVQSFIDDFNALAAAITAVATGVVAISLLVGGVGIMNIMLVSVSERTHEIGLRKALGAKASVILMQFLVEAVILCLTGGLLGLAIAQAGTIGLQNLPDAGLQSAVIPPWAIALSLIFSVGVGVLFGMFPAIKAARLDPIEALRHE